VKSSLEKLNIPAWYRDRQDQNQRQRHESGDSGLSCPGGGGHVSRWRCGSAREGYKRGSYSQTNSRDNSRCSTPAGSYWSSNTVQYHSSYSRWSTSKLNYITGKESSFTTPGTSPAHSSYSIKSLASNCTNTSLSDNLKRQPYTGWRSQEQLKNSGHVAPISTPAQRLATSSIRPNSVSSTYRRKVISDYSDFYKSKKREKSPPKYDNTALHDSIKQVTVAIDDYCKSSKRNRRPLTSKGTYEGLMESKQFSTGGHLWMESSFLPAKRQGVRKSRHEFSTFGDNGEFGLSGLRIEDQIF